MFDLIFLQTLSNMLKSLKNRPGADDLPVQHK